jgi:hypothetical protein
MKYTNEYNLPEPIVMAVINDPYDSGDSDITATTLIKPPQMVYLEKKHKDAIIVDVSARLWALYGQSVHGIAERAAQGNCLVEERFYATVNGWKISAQIDLLELNRGEYIPF